jgi:hypothetical protein
MQYTPELPTLSEADRLCNAALESLSRDLLGHAAREAAQACLLEPAHDEARLVHAMAQARLGNAPLARELLQALIAGPAAARLGASSAALLETARALHARVDAELRSTYASGRPLEACPPDPAVARWSATGDGKYELDHLDQAGNQRVAGPIQDDEALLLYAMVRVMRIRHVLEVGGLGGYSARNFLAAMQGDRDVAMYTIDLNDVPALSPHHYTIRKDCGELAPADVHGQPLDQLEAHGLVHANTVLALHDTNLHPKQGMWGHFVREPDGVIGWVHQAAEREMVNALRRRGWDAMCFHMPLDRSDELIRSRHGLTVMRRFQHLAT